MNKLLCLTLLALLPACGEAANDAATTNASGTWSGRLDGGESFVLVLVQTSGTYVGQACERPGEDCNALDTVTVNGNRVEFMRSFVENGRREFITGDLRVQGAAMTGTLFSTKCSCTLQAVLARQATP